MAKVGIVMGSDSDMTVMSKAAAVLEEFGIDYEMRIISAHREPEELVSWAKGAEERGIRVIIAGAGMAAALPGMVAALFPLPVIKPCNKFFCRLYQFSYRRSNILNVRQHLFRFLKEEIAPKYHYTIFPIPVTKRFHSVFFLLASISPLAGQPYRIQ